MGGQGDQFEADWLALREPVDHAARSARLAERLDEWVADRERLRVVDLGSGCGSNLRWLAPRLGGAQRWRLVDHDADLLARARRAALPAGRQGQRVDLDVQARDFAGLGPAVFCDVDVVTASALFDLVSEAWLKRFVADLADSGAAALIALTVDGRRWLTDAEGQALDEAADGWMAGLFNRHQRRSKGLGDALGPAAAEALPEALESAGLRVWSERSDWVLPSGRAETRRLGTALLEDWARAAIEVAPNDSASVLDWHRMRLDALASGTAGLAVGHVDVLALPQ